MKPLYDTRKREIYDDVPQKLPEPQVKKTKYSSQGIAPQLGNKICFKYIEIIRALSLKGGTCRVFVPAHLRAAYF